NLRLRVGLALPRSNCTVLQSNNLNREHAIVERVWARYQIGSLDSRERRRGCSSEIVEENARPGFRLAVVKPKIVGDCRRSHPRSSRGSGLSHNLDRRHIAQCTTAASQKKARRRIVVSPEQVPLAVQL